LAFFTQSNAKLCKILIITLDFEKSANFFRQKLAKIAENCDHNIDPWLSSFLRDFDPGVRFFAAAIDRRPDRETGHGSFLGHDGGTLAALETKSFGGNRHDEVSRIYWFESYLGDLLV
jgi:hypothetical protein